MAGPAEVRKLIAMKFETTEGTDIFADTYLTTDVLEADARSIRVTNDPNEIENLVLMGNLGRAPSLKGPRLSRIDFRCPVRGLVGGSEYDDSPLLVPPIHRPLISSGHAATFTNPGAASSSVLYKPVSAPHVTSTIYVIQPVTATLAIARQYVGCLGTARFNGVAGEGMFGEFSFVGAFEEEKDITFVAGTLTLAPKYPQLVSAAFQIGSTNYAPVIRTVGFDTGVRIGRRPSINASTGVLGFSVVDRRPVLTIDPEVDLDANSGWWAAFRDGEPLKDSTYQLGTVAKNRMKFRFAGNGTDANLQMITHELDSRDDMSCYRISLLPTIAAGNDDYSLMFD